MTPPLLAILMPVYNEERLLAASIERLRLVPPPLDAATQQPLRRAIVLVDDGSTDQTRAIAQQLATIGDVHFIAHERNRGKGAAVRTAMAAAIELGAAYLLIHDADLEYDPADHAKVLSPILQGKADVVIGTRFLGEEHRVLYFWHQLANRVITLYSNVLTNLNLTDIECCLKAFTREVAMQLRLQEDRFGIEPELIARLARTRPQGERGSRAVRIYEVAVSYAGRTYAEGKKIGWKDGVSALRAITRHNLFGPR